MSRLSTPIIIDRHARTRSNSRTHFSDETNSRTHFSDETHGYFPEIQQRAEQQAGAAHREIAFAEGNEGLVASRRVTVFNRCRHVRHVSAVYVCVCMCWFFCNGV